MSNDAAYLELETRRVEALGARVHGGLQHWDSVDATLRHGETDSRAALVIIDQSTCVDAFGLHAPVIDALERVQTRRSYRDYPDPQATRARRHLAEVLSVDVEQVDVGPGAAELIWTLVRATSRPGDRVLIWKPCFSEFEHAVRAVGAEVVDFHRGSGDVLRDLSRLADVVARTNPRAVYLCAPSCPRGEWVPAAELAALVARQPQTCFIVDQSYLNLSAHSHELHVSFPANAVLLRSLTKELSVPGVRVGYAILSPTLREQLQRQRPYWNMGSHALSVVEAYGECLSLINARRSQLLRAARQLATELQQKGACCNLQDAHYFTVSHAAEQVVSTSRSSAAACTALDSRQLRERLAARGIAVRDCASFGLPNHVRVVAHPQQQQLVEAWDTLARPPLEGGSGR